MLVSLHLICLDDIEQAMGVGGGGRISSRGVGGGDRISSRGGG